MNAYDNKLDFFTRDLLDQFIELRKQRGMTQDECADLIGMSEGMVSKWERGFRIPKLFHIGCYADVLDARLILTPYDSEPWPVDTSIASNDNRLFKGII